MTRTSCKVYFGTNALNALAIRNDAAFTLVQGGLQSFGTTSDINNDTTAAKPYATYEPSYWLLDGNFKFTPDASAHGGYISTAMSGSTGGFDFPASVPEIKIDFDSIYSTTGLTLYFSGSGDYADDIDISFYNSVGGLIRTDAYTPTSTTFETNQAVSNFKRIDIFINSTNRAQRYARISRIDFDSLLRFEGSDIKGARVVEEVNLLSLELPIDTLELNLFSSDGDFSIVDPAGFYANLQYKEPLDVYEEVNGDTLYIGRFYLDKWESLSANEAHFEASDGIGLLEGFNYLGYFYAFDIASTRLASVVIADIMDGVGVDYELDASLASIPIPGWINIGTCRYALQQALVAIGAYATCSRANVIQIRPFELAADLVTYDHTLTQADKGMTSPMTLRPLITGVEVTSHWYVGLSDIVSAFSQSLAAGAHRVYWGLDVPAVLDAIAGATDTTVTQRGTFADINVGAPGTVTIDIEQYSHTQRVHGVYNLSLPAGAVENVIQITDATTATPVNVVTVDNADDIAQRVYDYYAQRYLQKTKLFGSLLAPGDSVLVDVQSSRQLAGIVEKMETDLAGGYVSSVEIIGVII